MYQLPQKETHAYSNKKQKGHIRIPNFISWKPNRRIEENEKQVYKS